MTTIVYLDGGDRYMGEQEDRTLKEWLKYGYEHNQKFLYKGYRYFDNKKDIVVVFDTKRWSRKELEKRRQNGFLGITEHKIKGGECAD